MTVDQIIALAEEGFDAAADAVIIFAQRTLAEHGAAGYKGVNKAIKKIQRDLKDLKNVQNFGELKRSDIETRIDSLYPGSRTFKNQAGAVMIMLAKIAEGYRGIWLLAQLVKEGKFSVDILNQNITTLAGYHMALSLSSPRLYPAEDLVAPLMRKINAILSLIEEPAASGGNSGYADFSAN